MALGDFGVWEFRGETIAKAFTAMHVLVGMLVLYWSGRYLLDVFFVRQPDREKDKQLELKKLDLEGKKIDGEEMKVDVEERKVEIDGDVAKTRIQGETQRKGMEVEEAKFRGASEIPGGGGGQGKW